MTKYVCTVCGYIAEGSIPEFCPVCKAPASKFIEKKDNTYVTEHVVGIAKDVPEEIKQGLRGPGGCGIQTDKPGVLRKKRVAQRRGARQLRSNGAVHGLHGGRAGLVFSQFVQCRLDDGVDVAVQGQHPRSQYKNGQQAETAPPGLPPVFCTAPPHSTTPAYPMQKRPGAFRLQGVRRLGQ